MYNVGPNFARVLVNVESGCAVRGQSVWIKVERGCDMFNMYYPSVELL